MASGPNQIDPHALRTLPVGPHVLRTLPDRPFAEINPNSTLHLLFLIMISLFSHHIFQSRPNYNQKRSGMSPAATPTGISGNQSYGWHQSQNYYQGGLRYPQPNPAAYGSYAQVQVGFLRTVEMLVILYGFINIWLCHNISFCDSLFT